MIVPSARSKVWGESQGRSEEKASRKKYNTKMVVPFFLLASFTLVENGATAPQLPLWIGSIMKVQQANEGLPSSTDFLSHMYA